MTMFQSMLTGLRPIDVRVTDGSATTIIDASSTGHDSMVIVPWFSINHHSDTGVNLTVDVHDGTNPTYQGTMGSTWNAKALAGKMAVLFDQGIVVPKGSKLRVTSSSASGLLHVTGTKYPADK
jgi:hypothetical protein